MRGFFVCAICVLRIVHGVLANLSVFAGNV